MDSSARKREAAPPQRAIAAMARLSGTVPTHKLYARDGCHAWRAPVPADAPTLQSMDDAAAAVAAALRLDSVIDLDTPHAALAAQLENRLAREICAKGRQGARARQLLPQLRAAERRLEALELLQPQAGCAGEAGTDCFYTLLPSREQDPLKPVVKTASAKLYARAKCGAPICPDFPCLVRTSLIFVLMPTVNVRRCLSGDVQGDGDAQLHQGVFQAVQAP